MHLDTRESKETTRLKSVRPEPIIVPKESMTINIKDDL